MVSILPVSPSIIRVAIFNYQKRLRRQPFLLKRQNNFRSAYTCLRNAATVSWAALRVFTT